MEKGRVAWRQEDKDAGKQVAQRYEDMDAGTQRQTGRERERVTVREPKRQGGEEGE